MWEGRISRLKTIEHLCQTKIEKSVAKERWKEKQGTQRAKSPIQMIRFNEYTSDCLLLENSMENGDFFEFSIICWSNKCSSSDKSQIFADSWALILPGACV